MGYEYMRGLGTLGATAGKPRLALEESLELVKEKCGGIGCVGVTTEPVIFSTENPETASQILANMSSRGCFMQCSKDQISYYCCPPFEEESPLEREVRIAEACRGEPCSEPGMTRHAAFRTNTMRGIDRAKQAARRGCTPRCEENNWAYFCCPSGDKKAPVQEPAAVSSAAIQELPPPVQSGGFPWGGAALALLLLGGAGFAGYWFLLRDDGGKNEGL